MTTLIYLERPPIILKVTDSYNLGVLLSVSYDIYVKRRVDEVEESLLKYMDPVERLHVWFVFIKDFTMEAHTLLDAQYGELVHMCKTYSSTPDMVAREDARGQVVAIVREIDNINTQLKRIPRLQSKLEKDILDTTDL